jgi:hypothetical protein
MELTSSHNKENDGRLESILETKVSGDAWRDFVGGSWEKYVNVREFIQ